MKNLFRKLVPLFLVVSLVFTMGAQGISVGDDTEDGEKEEVAIENMEEEMEEVEEDFNPSLTLDLYTDKETYKNGEIISYQIKVKNDGDVDLEKINLKDGLNDGDVIERLKADEEKVIEKEFKISEGNDLEQVKNKVEAKAMFENEEIKDDASFVIGVEKEEEQKEPENENSEEEAEEEESEEPENEEEQDNKDEEKDEDLEGVNEDEEVEEDKENEEQDNEDENDEEIDKDKEENEEVEDELAENYPPVKGKPDIALPDSFYQKSMRTASNEGLEDTIEVDKQAERIKGCRTFQVVLDITGEPQEAPVDVVLVLDRSGSMNQGTRLYDAKQAAINFAGRVLGSNGIPGSRVSVVSFSGPRYSNGSWGNPQRHYGRQNQADTNLNLTSNLITVTNTINGISAVGGTNTEAGFIEGQSVIQGSTSNQNPNSNKVVIMFTDGLPTVSNGNPYQETTNINHTHIQKAIAAGQNIYQNGIADVFTIGLTTGMNSTENALANNILTQAQNKGYYEAPSSGDLDAIFNNISTQLGYAGTNAAVVDKIGDNFELVPGSLPAGASYNPNTREITWEPGTIVEEASLTYEVVAKSSFPGGLANTNEYAKLTYTDVFGNGNQEKDFPVPEVDVPTLLEVSLTDATITTGDSISLGTGTNPAGENYMSDITGGDGDGNYTYEWRIAGESNVISTDENPSVSPTEDTEYELTVIDSNGCIAVATMKVFVEELRTDFGIKKIDGASEELLDGAKFVLKKDGEEIDTDDTVSGYAWMRDLLPGTYTLEETVAPDGYKDNEQVYTVVIDEEGNITVDPELVIEEDDGMQVIVIENELLEFDIGIKKIDISTDVLLDGAKFLLKKDGQEIRTIEISSGYAWIDGLVAGTYTLEEVKAPDGYRLDNTVYEIVIDEEGNITTDPILTIIEEDGKQVIVLRNKPKTDLPQTGGPGSLVFSLLGISLIAISYMRYRKRYN